MPVDPRAAFAALINAKREEISYIPNTSTGENLVVEALGITRFDGNVVTDALHFEGALVHLLELKKQGLDLRLVMPREGRIDMRDLERVVDRNTKLIEVSLVSMYNGFQHDLKAVCDLAHAHGAYVYADIIQGVGAVPIRRPRDRRRFRRDGHLQVADGRFRAGLPVRARGAAWHA